MTKPAQSNTSSTFVCALSGNFPIIDPVVTPSGFICSRRLLLSKLSENGGVDPFVDRGGKSRSLDESQLVDLHSDVNNNGSGFAPIPPRPPKATSFPSLLTFIRDEYDAMLLELYDTRKALEETRKELSSALYQNDAAVRVIARLARERDESRQKVIEFLAKEDRRATREDGIKEVKVDLGEKRGRDEDHEHVEKINPSFKKGKVDREASSNNLSEIPPAEIDAMTSTWKTLSKSRRSKSKAKKGAEALKKKVAIFKELKQVKKINLHKSSAGPGILAVCYFASRATNNEYIVTGGYDKEVIVYNHTSGAMEATLSGATAEITSINGTCLSKGEADESNELSEVVIVATGSMDGIVRLYIVPLSRNEELSQVDYVAITLPSKIDKEGVNKEPPSPIVSVIVHASSTVDEVRLLAITQDGRVAFLKSVSSSPLSSSKKHLTLNLLAVLQQEETSLYTSGALHPDGLIFAAGTKDGKLVIWDLKTQAVASILECHNGNEVNCVAFSENGYHVATSSASDSILIWDLRKLKTIASVDPNKGSEKGHDDSATSAGIGRILSVSFDPSGSYLAYQGEEATKICLVKEWDKVICTLAAAKSSRQSSVKCGGIVWGGKDLTELDDGDEANIWLATVSDGERPIRFWGACRDEPVQ